MMRFLTLIEVLELHRRVIEQSGGAFGIRDTGLLESAISQPRMTFGGEDLYPSLLEKAAALGFSIVMNHPFVDGNKCRYNRHLQKIVFCRGMARLPASF
jgi:death on curing protein